MRKKKPPLLPIEDRGPLRVMFVITCMPVGGAETLLVNLIRRMDRNRFLPELCCLKYFGPLGEELAKEIPAFEGLLQHKYDFSVWKKLTDLLRKRRIDAVVTVGTGGDKMFWGRLAAFRASVPVVLSALHSTGLPDHVELPNRMLAPWTDGFIAVAKSHGVYLHRHEGCPQKKVFVVPNGVDVERFRPLSEPTGLRATWNIPDGAPIAGIVAALRPEKNHELFLRAAARTVREIPQAHFLVVGDGDRRGMLEQLNESLGLKEHVHFIGTRADIPQVLSMMNLLVLSSHMEANPVSILEAMACGKPVLATRVGSIPESVHDGQTGLLVDAGNEEQLAAGMVRLLQNQELARSMGRAGREFAVNHGSVESMVDGYQDLLAAIYQAKAGGNPSWLKKEPATSSNSPSNSSSQ